MPLNCQHVRLKSEMALPGDMGGEAICSPPLLPSVKGDEVLISHDMGPLDIHALTIRTSRKFFLNFIFQHVGLYITYIH